jgi:hypothetical protein
MRRLFVACLLALSVVTFAVNGQAQQRKAIPREMSLAAHGGSGAVDVDGTLLLPRSGGTVRGIIAVAQWGLGTAVYEDPAWRQLADDLHLGLLRLDIRNHDGPEDQLTLPAAQQAVRNASLGGAEALLKLLDDSARDTGHSELRNANLIFWGHSAAGTFGTTFAAMHPARTIAFVRYHSHSRGLPTTLATTSKIPALIFAGEKDTTAGVEDSEALWKSGRLVGAPWTFALEPGATHGSAEALRKANQLAIPWIRSVLSQRLKNAGAGLRSVDQASGWLASSAPRQIARAGSFRGSKSEASWLPDKTSATEWLGVTDARANSR